MRVSRIGVLAVVALPFAVSLVSLSAGNPRKDPAQQSSPQVPTAQSSSQPPSESAPPRFVPHHPRRPSAGRPPCWRLAGIPPELVNQRWRIEDNAKGKINGVCTDPALAAEKKREKIQEINAETDQEIAKIIPAKQLETFKACQADRDQEAKLQGATPQKELGPCGGVIPEQPGDAQQTHEHPSSKPVNP